MLNFEAVGGKAISSRYTAVGAPHAEVSCAEAVDGVSSLVEVGSENSPCQPLSTTHAHGAVARIAAYCRPMHATGQACISCLD